MQIATLTDVGKKVGGGSADACAHEKASGSEHELTPSDQPPTGFAANGKGERPAPTCRIHPERLSELVEAADWTQIGKSRPETICTNCRLGKKIWVYPTPTRLKCCAK